MTEPIEKSITTLEERANRLRQMLKYARRAFVIEFAGTPKSGKSTSVEAVRHFFSRNGFRVHVLAERAAVCPIPMKGHLFFNTWCACTMLAELLENIEADSDIVIVDRGIFDALVWLTLQESRGELVADEKKKIEAFLLLDRWRTLIDLAIVMHVDAEEALKREKAQRISSKLGSVMNPDVLNAITNSVSTALRNYDGLFSLVPLDTSYRDVRGSNIELANSILDHLDSFLNPKIWVVPRPRLENLPLTNGDAFTKKALDELLKRIAKYGEFIHRDDAEQNTDYVQIVSCGVLTSKNEVFVFQRRDRDPKSEVYGKTTGYTCCGANRQKRSRCLGICSHATDNPVAAPQRRLSS